MRVLLIVLVAAAAVLEAAQAKRFHDLLEPRLFASAIRIDRLSHEIEELEHEIEEAAKIDPLGFIMEMHARLDEVEGKSVNFHFPFPLRGRAINANP